MRYNLAALQNLVDQFERMQGIGHKTAQRMAFYVLGLSDEETRAFTDAITEAHTKIHQCKICCNKELLARLNDGTVEEVIMATNPTVEGEATAMYISRLLKPMGITVSRLAYGVPVGADLEYADEVTLSRALEGRSLI